MFAKLKEQLKKDFIEKHRLEWEKELTERKEDFKRLCENIEHENNKLQKQLEVKNVELGCMLDLNLLYLKVQ